MKKYNKTNIPIGMVKELFCTGKDRNGRRFRISSMSLWYLNCINAYSNKKVWAKLDNGQRILISRH